MNDAARRLRAAYAITPGAPFPLQEFGYYCLDTWRAQGCFTDFDEVTRSLGLTGGGLHMLTGMGDCTAPFFPKFPVELLSSDGEHELEQDEAGRKVLYFKGRRNGFMPTYVDHPVKDAKSWADNCLWRLNPDTPERLTALDTQLPAAVEAQANGELLCGYIVGAYMYLRSLIGGEALLYTFYDDPALVHTCMEQWLAVSDRAMARYQASVSFDEILLDEDICYNHGLLISPDMWREFIQPYYEQLFKNIRARQPGHPVGLYLATDGDLRPAIPLYAPLGLTHLSPLEVASGCDVVEIGRKYPKLLLSGGIDKRILAAGRDAIDRELERILPVMRARGGYIPTCDHGVPEEVPFEDWYYYRRRVQEYAD